MVEGATTKEDLVIDYLLIKNLYKCTPEELDRQDYFITSLHSDFMSLEAKSGKMLKRRAEQKAKLERMNKK